MAIKRSCGLTTVSIFLASLLKKKEAAARQQAREWLWDKKDKAGKKRQDWEVEECFEGLLRWVLSLWPVGEKRIALAMDATTLKARFTVLAISVVFCGCGIPIAWVVLPATGKKAWKGEWLRLFTRLQGIIPEDWLVIVMADRGLYANWLFQSIRENGWHPFLRINQGGKYRPEGASEFCELGKVVKGVGDSWAGAVTCFKSNPVKATLLAKWEEKYTDPWLILTDLSPEQAQISWYGMRAWIECCFKAIKRAGWDWQNTRMTDPKRAARLWLAIAVATLWAVTVGGEADDHLPVSSLADLPETHVARRHHTTANSRPARSFSLFHRGLTEILVSILRGELVLPRPITFSIWAPLAPANP